MNAVVLTIHTMIVLALVVVVLLQRSEGGALGMGGGGGAGGGLMSGRGAATALTRTTTTLAALFFATSLTLALIADRGEPDTGFLPTEDERTLDEDDFSDILGGAGTEGEETSEEQPEDLFSLPDNLGTEEAAQPEEEPQR